MALRTWLRTLFTQTAHGQTRAALSRQRRLFLEPLEVRALLATFEVNTVADTVDANPAVTSLREAITAANSQAGDDVIDFNVAGTINLAGALPDLSSNVQIQGLGADNLTIRRDTGGDYRVFTVVAGSTVSLDGLTISNGVGGGIYNDGGTLAVSNSSFSANTGVNFMLFNPGFLVGTVTITTKVGSGIHNANGGVVTVSASRFTGNLGSAIFNDSTLLEEITLTVTDSRFTGNDGGGIVNTGILEVSNSDFVENMGALMVGTQVNGEPAEAPVGSGIANYGGGTATVEGSTFHKNGGSPIFNYDPSPATSPTTVIVAASTFSENETGYGGGILSYGGVLEVSSSTFANNSAIGRSQSSGGGINSFGGGSLLVTNSTFYGNQALFGGGISATVGLANVTIINSTIAGNEGGVRGGGIFHWQGHLTLHNTIVANNTSFIEVNNRNLALFSDDLSGSSHNFIEDGGRPGMTDTVTGDPKLGPLANYGGPTLTMPLLPGSSAIDAGHALVPGGVPATDQRGVPRIHGANVDIGAFESSGDGLLVTGSGDADGITVEPGSLPGTLKTTVTNLITSVSVVTDNIAVTGIVLVQGLGGDDTITITKSLAGHVVVDGGGGSDAYDITFGDLAGTVAVADSGAAEEDDDTLTVHGTTLGDDLDISTKSFVKWKPFGAAGDYQSRVDFSGIEDAILNAGAGDDTVHDPESANLTILGGPGSDTIIVADNIGLITVDGGDGSDQYIVRAKSFIPLQFIGVVGLETYIIQIGDPQGPVNINDTGTVGTDAVIVYGTPSADAITQSGNQVIVNGAVITLAGADALTVDSGGGTSDTFSVVGAPTIPTTVAGVSDMVIVGTPGNDQIHFHPGNGAGQVVATLNGIVVAAFSPTGRIVAYGNEGDDDIQVAGGVTLPAWLYGDAGNDRLNAGNGGSLLIGGADNDDLKGGNGRDVMIGGEGADKLNGGGNDDILVAGFTTMDSRSVPGHEEFWRLVLLEWNSSNSFAVRVKNLRNGTGGNAHNGGSFLLPNVVDDLLANGTDFLNGASGDDWILCQAGVDKVTGKAEASD